MMESLRTCLELRCLVAKGEVRDWQEGHRVERLTAKL